MINEYAQIFFFIAKVFFVVELGVNLNYWTDQNNNNKETIK